MLPKRFTYHRPGSLAEAHDLSRQFGDDAGFIAGGTELLIALKARVLQYEHIIDLKQIPALHGVRMENDRIVIGPLTTHFELARDPLIRASLPGFAALSNNVANIRVRVAGTVGGNICFAEPHADPPAMLAALGAELTLSGPDVERVTTVDDFIQSEFTTSREPFELLTKIEVPVSSSRANFCYEKFGHLERPAVGVAAGYVGNQNAGQWHVWAAAICGKPTRVSSFENALDAATFDGIDDICDQASIFAAATLDASDDLWGSADYKQHLASVLMKRAVIRARNSVRGLTQ